MKSGTVRLALGSEYCKPEPIFVNLQWRAGKASLRFAYECEVDLGARSEGPPTLDPSDSSRRQGPYKVARRLCAG